MDGEEVEIVLDLALDERQRRLVDAHSVANIILIVIHAVDLVGTLSTDAAAAERLEEQLAEWGTGLADRQRASSQLRGVREMRVRVIRWVAGQRPRVPEGQRSFVDRHVDNLESVFDILETRIAELIARADGMNHWCTVSLEQVRTKLHAMFKAVEKNSFGRYRIAFSPFDQGPGDYLMEFDLQSPDGVSIRMPAVLEDTLRDLACNARKYTDPGGVIRSTLRQENDGALFLAVEDNGLGIAPNEIEDIVRFGHRSPSVIGRAQSGGGFGLTKAYFVTRELGGRMWIRSNPGAGTRVTIRVPAPPVGASLERACA